jgi:hypothetical protein
MLLNESLCIFGRETQQGIFTEVIKRVEIKRIAAID